MDDNLKPLPTLSDDILVSILVVLPFFDVLRLRVVCSRWNKLLKSEHFLQQWRASESRKLPFCFMSSEQVFDDHGIEVYHPQYKGQVHGVDFSPSYTFSKGNSASYVATDARVMGAAEGLLLVEVLVPQESAGKDMNARSKNARYLKHDLYVMNPNVPSAKKRVPLLPHLRHHITSSPLGMVWDQTSHSHRILIHYHPEGQKFSTPERTSIYWSFYSYDVQSDVWTHVARWPRDTRVEFQSPSICGGRFYCLGESLTPGLLTRFRMYAQSLDITSPCWIMDEDDSTPPDSLDIAALVHRDQETLVAGGRMGSSYGSQKSTHQKLLQEFCVWSLQGGFAHISEEGDRQKRQWVEIHRMPTEVLMRLNGNETSGKFYCTANDKFVWVVTSKRNGAMLDMSSNSWWTFPDNPPRTLSDSVEGKQLILHMLPFKLLDHLPNQDKRVGM